MHVVDKATKLQTIFDRIQLVDTRFELIRRDIELATLRRQMALGPDATGAARERIERDGADLLNEVEGDRAFLRQANIGSERM
ncbi:hypothetical protein ABTO78_20875, partial [Acinetobacter baumannii]